MNRKKQLFFIVGVALAALGIYALVRTLSQTDETRIQRVIYAAVTGVESNDPARYGRILSLSYQDEVGRNKIVLLKVVEEIFAEFRPLRVEIKQLTITLGEDDPETAQVTIGFKIYFKRLPEGKMYYEAGRFETDFVREGREWRIRSLSYIDADEIMFIQAVA